MFKLYATSFFLAFLASETYSFGIKKEQSTDARVSVFTNDGPSNTYTLTVADTTCSIRIDFVTFVFDQPTKQLVTAACACERELKNVLKMVTTGPSAMDLPDLCGKLSGQHMYLPTRNYKGKVIGEKSIEKLKLAVLRPLLSTSEPLWNITFTQLPCQSEKDAEQSKPSDSPPPIECTQFYTEPKGSVESFNLGHTLCEIENYTICFSLPPSTCGLKLLEINTDLVTISVPSIDQFCDKLDLIGYPGLNMDYLVLSDGVTMNGISRLFPSKYCGKYTPKTFDISVAGPGPHYVGIGLLGLNDVINLARGFKAEYKILKDKDCE